MTTVKSVQGKLVAAFAGPALAIGLLGSAQIAQATAILDVTEIGTYTQIYQLDIQNNSNFDGGVPVYGINNAGTPIAGGINRIGYYLELQAATGARQWVWASMTAFTQNLGQTGVPVASTGAVWQQLVSSLNVQSNVGSIVQGTGITTGNIEFWSNCYSTGNEIGISGANAGQYDFGDDNRHTASCYGSMQVHNYGASQTLFAYNSWDYGANDDLGIGNQASGHPDWTFAANAGNYTLKSLEVWVQATNQQVPEPLSLGLVGIGLLGLLITRRR